MHRTADGDTSSLMGMYSAPPACYNFPQSTFLLGKLFKPTSLGAESLAPGRVYNYTMAHEWAGPSRLADGFEVVGW